MARIFLRNKVWWTDVRTNDVRLRESTHTQNKDLALKVLADRMRQYDDGKITGIITVGAAKTKYLAHRQAMRNPKTFQADALALGDLDDTMNLSEFTPDTLFTIRERYVLEKKTRPAAANRRFRSILLFLTYCESENWIQQRRWEKVSKPFFEPRPRLLYFTEGQMRQIFRNFKTGWVATVTRLGYYAGLRRSEIYYLRWDDVDFTRKRIVLHPKDGWKPKAMREKDEPPWVPMHRELERHLRSMPRSSPRVLPEDAPNLQAMSIHYKAILNGLGLPGSLHTLRHTIASHLASAGVDIFKIKEFLRHSRIEQTMVYAKLSPEARRDVLGAIPTL